MTATAINPVNQALIAHVLNEARQGNYNRCRALGFTDEMVAQLQGLSPKALAMVNNTSVVWIKPQVDKELFNRVLDRVAQEEERDRLILRTLKLGASTPMMRRFFGLGHSEIAARRRAAGLSTTRGRLPEVPHDKKIPVWERWIELVHQQDEYRTSEGVSYSGRHSQYGEDLDEMSQLDLIMMIAEEQNLPLASIWSELMSHLEPEESKNEHPANEKVELDLPIGQTTLPLVLTGD